MPSFHHHIKSGRKGSAKERAAYIERRGRYSDREDLLFTEHGNLPSWAENNPAKFWAAADKYERQNGAAYREHEIALPNELNDEQLRVLVKSLTQEVIGRKPYHLAVHAPQGKLGGIPNTHLHLMFSDRVPDEYERPPETTFARYNPANPAIGGRRKDSGGKSRLELRDQVIATRKTIADLQNQALAAAGFEARVDHRRLDEQGECRQPERHLGPARVRRMSEDEKMGYTEKRAASVGAAQSMEITL